MMAANAEPGRSRQKEMTDKRVHGHAGFEPTAHRHPGEKQTGSPHVTNEYCTNNLSPIIS